MRTEAFRFSQELELSQLVMNGSTLAIAPEEFCALAVSSRPLVRCDDSARGLRGLRDLQTGEFFVVNANELQSHNLTTA